MTRSQLPVLAVSGMNAEARIAVGHGVATLAGGGDPARLALLLQGALARGVRAVISFGVAGGLAPGLRPGTVILGRSVDDGETRSLADPAWLRRLADALPHAHVADLAGVDHMVIGADNKRALHQATRAAAVDMESHIAARLAAQHGVPFAALRIIADPAERSLPHAATVGMRPDGSTDVRAVLRSLAGRPAELPALIRTALDARAAFMALQQSRKLLCGLLGFAEHADVGTAELAIELVGGRQLMDLEGALGGFGGPAEVQNT